MTLMTSYSTARNVVTDIIDELNPSPRLLMGPGPVNADPRVLRAMSMPLLGQFDAEFTGYMNDVMGLLRRLLQTQNEWAFLIDGTARAGIEAALVSLLEPGDHVLVPIFGRFGHLLCEIARRCGTEVRVIETEWGTVFDPQQIETALEQHRPSVVAVVHGDTSTTMAQPLDDLGAICRCYDALLYVDAWQLDIVSAGLQKCLSGPSGSAPLTFNERVVKVVERRKHIEQGLQLEGFVPAAGAPIQSNYFDLCMLMDYWSPQCLNHHTEASSMLYAARECAQLALQEGLDACFARLARRIGAMGYTCRKPNGLHCLGALEAALRQHGFLLSSGAAVDAAMQIYRDAGL